ncbi:type B 50S ribosomal protein L31 [Parashewanella tropica]|uniref:type B 50S ribosomal protein L31 n=1 Tax=Parashewanella tropica TaxID=2547970 RepID=UPI001059DFDB|nr:type B 50S ribosomal protein L31 [Parashewanella tropica]
MKKGIHPEYDYVVFRDSSSNTDFLIRSTCKSDKTVTWTDGNTYPLIHLDISSASHPVYTGEKQQAKSEGRVAQFNKRFGNTASKSR